MSVRRLAEDTVQPASFAFSQENQTWAERTIGRYPEGRQQSAVIPLLMRAQEQDGWVTKAAIEHIADRLAMPLIRVLEVATFYTQFQLKPVGTKAHVQVCGTTPCMLRGSDALKDVCRSKIHHDQFHLNASGTLSWEEVECLGACVNAPMVMIFKDTYEDLTPERLAEIIDAFEDGEGASVRVGPQTDRHLSAPAGGATTLRSPNGNEGARGATESGPAAGSASNQGVGAGGSVSSETQAGRPDTHAAETDPSMAGPGKAANGNVDQDVEASHKIDLKTDASRPGAGETGGTNQGPTGAHEKDADATERGSVAKDADTARRDGPLGEKGNADEEAVVQSHKVVEGVDHSSDHGVPASDAHRGDAASLPDGVPTRAGEEIAPPVEGRRVTDDVLPGPVASDGAAVDDIEKRRAEAGATRPQDISESGRSVPGEVGYTPQDGSAGDKPTNLLAAPEGQADDLKVVKGIGPVIERSLNDLGVYHLRQIAAWGPRELAWVDRYINFNGRAVREKWVEQARAFDAAKPGAAQ